MAEAKYYYRLEENPDAETIERIQVFENHVLVGHITEKGNFFPYAKNDPIFSPADLRELSGHCMRQKRKIEKQERTKTKSI